MTSPVALPVMRPASMSEHDFSALKEHAQGLEGLFLHTLISEMFSSLETEAPFGGGFAEETWRGMMAEEYSTAFAKAGGIGLADRILSDLIANQSSLPSVSPQFAAGAYAR
jgi:Rod binding domain-containing protein